MPDTPPAWLTVSQVAQLFGVHRRTVYDWLADGSLKGFRIGQRAVRVRREDLDALLQEYLLPSD